MLNLKASISVADGLLSPEVCAALVRWLNNLEYRYYRITNKNEKDPFPIWHRELIGRDWPINQPSEFSCTESILANTDTPMADIWRACMKALGLPERTQCHGVYANGNTHGNEGNPHIDSQHPLDRTLLIYGVMEWREGWGGETAFYNEQGDTAGMVTPRPGRVIFFDGGIRHGVTPISRACKILRPVLVFKIRLPEVHA